VCRWKKATPRQNYLFGAMTFAKCIGGEPDRDFGSPMSREMLPSRLKMRQLLGWTKGSNNRSESESRSQQQIQQNNPDDQQSPATDVKQTLSASSPVPSKVESVILCCSPLLVSLTHYFLCIMLTTDNCFRRNEQSRGADLG
jgi:hypothetical protein